MNRRINSWENRRSNKESNNTT